MMNKVQQAINLQTLEERERHDGQLDFESREFLINLMILLRGVDAAEQYALRLLEKCPGEPLFYYHLAMIRAVRNEGSARDWLVSQVELRSNSRYFLHVAGMFMNNIGDHQRAMDYIERSSIGESYKKNFVNNFVFAGMYCHPLEETDFLRRLRLINERQFGQPKPVPLHKPGKPRFIVGFVAAQFDNHALTYFLEPLLRVLDRRKFMILMFSSERRSSEFYCRIEGLVDVMYDVRDMSDPRLLELIRAERVDLLVDLDHHTKNNRLWVFAQRAAPVQITMYGLQLSTGIAAMDYRLTDWLVDPPGVENAYSEALLRSPRLHFTHSTLLPPSDPIGSPIAKNGYLTLGSFNNWRKINEATTRIWAAVMRALPDSRLVVAGVVGGLPQQRLLRWFEAAGVDSGRLEIHDRLGLSDLHRLVRQVDLALDSFPYGGGVTTAMILELGVPVATLKGDRAVSRMGAAMLKSIGTPELTYNDSEALVAGITGLARDPGALYRARDQVVANYPGSIGDARACAAEIEKLWLYALARARDGLPPLAFP